jgi:hypothetical protein
VGVVWTTFCSTTGMPTSATGLPAPIGEMATPQRRHPYSSRLDFGISDSTESTRALSPIIIGRNGCSTDWASVSRDVPARIVSWTGDIAIWSYSGFSVQSFGPSYLGMYRNRFRPIVTERARSMTDRAERSRLTCYSGSPCCCHAG